MAQVTQQSAISLLQQQINLQILTLEIILSQRINLFLIIQIVIAHQTVILVSALIKIHLLRQIPLYRHRMLHNQRVQRHQAIAIMSAKKFVIKYYDLWIIYWGTSINIFLLLPTVNFPLPSSYWNWIWYFLCDSHYLCRFRSISYK